MWAKEKGACGVDFQYVVFELHDKQMVSLCNSLLFSTLTNHLKERFILHVCVSDDCDEHGSAKIVPCIVAQVSSPTFEQEYRVGRSNRRTWNRQGQWCVGTNLHRLIRADCAHLLLTLHSLMSAQKLKSTMVGVFTAGVLGDVTN